MEMGKMKKILKAVSKILALFQKSIDFKQSPTFVIMSAAKNPRIYGEIP